LIEGNSPVDIGTEQIAQYKEGVEQIITEYRYSNNVHSLPELIRECDAEEKHVMDSVERETYVALRDGMQIFKAVSVQVGDKVGLRQRLMQVSSADLGTDAQLKEMRDFTYTFAAYAASKYVSAKLETILHDAGVEGEGEKPDLTALRVNTLQAEEGVMRYLLAPLYANLVKQKQDGGVFKTPHEFPLFVKEVFDKYIEITEVRKDAHPTLLQHIDGYRFRIMGGVVELDGFEDRSGPRITAVEQKATFMPIDPREIVGNKAARYTDRLALYNREEQINPILDLGGLSWSNLFDGVPGTGKTSLFRMAMTLLSQRAEQLGVPYHIVTVDQSIKDEYYGKSGKILLERLAVAKDPSALTVVLYDDIDLLTSTRDEGQGADNDITNITMQYLDGAFTVRRGNVINFAASNKPTGVDDALRNRFSDRLLIDGPVTAEDFADVLMLMSGSLMDGNLLEIQEGYTPFATQDIRNADGTWTATEDVAAYMADRFAEYKSASVIDFGKFMASLKEQNPLITGRSAHAIVEAIKERSADFDVPEEWFENRETFFDKSLDEQQRMLRPLYVDIKPDVLFQEAQRYFDSEERFKRTEAEGHVERGYNNMRWNSEAEVRFLEKELARGNESVLSRLQKARMVVDIHHKETQRVVREALERANEADKK
jgi:SpoVK/Ycf46/Vps4 family AAA+-type ATPase